MSLLRIFVAFICGAVFTIGLAIGGMTQPAKVVGFLDVFGKWDYSLVFVMASAVGVYYIGIQALSKKGKPVFAPRFLLPTKKDIDLRIIIGSILFGAGWGISGLCPGPVLSTLATGTSSILTLFLTMIIGLYASIYINK